MTKKIRLVQYIRPLLPWVPEIPPPSRKLGFQEKITWTIFALLLYLVASQVPLYGVMHPGKNDPFYWLRVILASNRGTLMELGTGFREKYILGLIK